MNESHEAGLSFEAKAVGGRVMVMTYACQTGWCEHGGKQFSVEWPKADGWNGQETPFFIKAQLICPGCGFEPTRINNPFDRLDQ
jgi:hypothetical protein